MMIQQLLIWYIFDVAALGCGAHENRVQEELVLAKPAAQLSYSSVECQCWWSWGYVRTGAVCGCVSWIEFAAVWAEFARKLVQLPVHAPCLWHIYIVCTMDMQRDRHGWITWLQKKDDSGMLHTHVLMWVARSWVCMLMWLVTLIEGFWFGGSKSRGQRIGCWWRSWSLCGCLGLSRILCSLHRIHKEFSGMAQNIDAPCRFCRCLLILCQRVLPSKRACSLGLGLNKITHIAFIGEHPVLGRALHCPLMYPNQNPGKWRKDFEVAVVDCWLN